MNQSFRCPRCGKTGSGELQGLCPECLLQTAMQGSGPADLSTLVQLGDVQPAGGESMPQPGQLFGGYRILRPLGRGGMGTVFEAEQLENGRRLALKVLSHSLDSSEARQRFLREGRLAASVNHPNNVYIFGTEEINATPVITMELVAGGTLKDRVQNEGPLPIQSAVDGVLQVISGLEAAQAAGVLHRDIKPSNCFVDNDGTVKVGDFGLSISKVARTEPHLTLSGVFLGTPTFASPEQLRGDELDLRSDMYALGVTLYYLLTGKVPFEADNMVRLVATVLERPAPSPRVLRPDLPAGLAAVILKCLEKQPANRYRTYGDLRAALLPFSSYVPVPAPLPIRFMAGLADAATMAALQLVAFLTLHLVMSENAPDAMWDWNPPTDELSWLTFYLVQEGIWGTSIGKWLFRLRVADNERRPPKLQRVAVRAAIFAFIPGLPLLLYTSLASPQFVETNFGLTLAVTSTIFVLLALLFVTARRSNNYAAIHDLLSGTRVLVQPVAAVRPTLAETPTPTAQSTGDAKIGPYHVLEELQAGQAAEWLLGYDARLLRKVWIRRLSADAAETPAALRSLTRAGRLRWLGGRRGADENWDAFEAPTGQALWQLLERPQPWKKVRFWLMDLADELSSALKDGALPDVLALDRVWITADGRAKLLDFPAPGVPTAAAAVTSVDKMDVTPVRQFLYQVAGACLEGKQTNSAAPIQRPLPVHARTFLEGLPHIQRPEVAVAQLQLLATLPVEVTRARRGAVLLLCLSLPLIMVLGTVLTHLSMVWAKQQNPQVGKLHTSLTLLEQSNELRTPLETYIAYHFRSVISNPATWKNAYVEMNITPEQRQLAERIVKERARPTAAEAREAARVVEPLLTWVEVGGYPNILDMASAIFLVTLMLVVAPASLLCALLFRGGFAWGTLGLAVVTKSGAPASRWRIFGRNLIAWSPALAWSVITLWLPIAAATSSMWCFLAAYGGLALWSLWLQRGLPDRLAGTWLVMR